MKLKAITKESHVMAVIVDINNKKSEVIDSTYLGISTFVVNQISKVIQVSLVWGGYDSNNHWHTDHSRPAANISISGERPGEDTIFNELVRNKNNEFYNDFSVNFFRRMFKDCKIAEFINDRVWGYDEVEIIDENHPTDKIIFSRKKIKQ